MPSFSLTTKNELAHVFDTRSCCLLSELAGLARAAGRVVRGPEGRLHFEIQTENAAVARKAFRLVRAVFGQQAILQVHHQRRLRGKKLFCVLIPETLPVAMSKLGLVDRFGHPVSSIRRIFIRRECCRRAYLRGLFLGRGWISGRVPSYHLEFVTPSAPFAAELLQLLEEVGLRARVSIRKNSFVVYLKKASAVSDCLQLMGATGALLDLENIRVLREVKNRVNRLVNCETANLNKTVEAALRQREDIEFISSCLGLENLPEDLRQLAALRLSHPEATLKELGELMQPPVSKSCVNHRLRRLAEIARQLRQEEGGFRGRDR